MTNPQDDKSIERSDSKAENALLEIAKDLKREQESLPPQRGAKHQLDKGEEMISSRQERLALIQDSRSSAEKQAVLLLSENFDIEKPLTEMKKIIDEAVQLYGFLTAVVLCKDPKLNLKDPNLNNIIANNLTTAQKEDWNLIIAKLENQSVNLTDINIKANIDYWKKEKQEILKTVPQVAIAGRAVQASLEGQTELMSTKTSFKEEITDFMKEHPTLTTVAGCAVAFGGIIVASKLFGHAWKWLSGNNDSDKKSDSILDRLFGKIKTAALVSLGIPVGLAAVSQVPKVAEIAEKAAGYVMDTKAVKGIVAWLENLTGVKIKEESYSAIAEVLKDPNIPKNERLSRLLEVINEGIDPEAKLHAKAVEEIASFFGNEKPRLSKTTLRLLGTTNYHEFIEKDHIAGRGIFTRLSDFVDSKTHSALETLHLPNFISDIWKVNPELRNDKETVKLFFQRKGFNVPKDKPDLTIDQALAMLLNTELEQPQLQTEEIAKQEEAAKIEEEKKKRTINDIIDLGAMGEILQVARNHEWKNMTVFIENLNKKESWDKY